ncbi:MAG: phosphatase PAP2 family protein [Prevotellaceae bacterium]|nr:phosphatase PAP2 family protein [Prevotellaceae bacterium]
MKKTILIVLLTTIVVQCAYSQNWDVDMLHTINSWDSPFMRDYNSFISRTEPYAVIGVPIIIGVTGWATHDKKMMKSALYTGVSVAGAFAVSYGMKYLVNRERPYVTYPDLIHNYSLESSPSFPSAHTATAFALATSLSLEYPKWYVIAPSALWACSVGMSRMNEGVHYPSDVLAGAAIGAGCAVLNFYANRWLNRWLFGER